MNPDEAQASAERDQLWASLRALRPHIDRIAVGEYVADEADKKIVILLARIVAAEMDYRAREAG